MLNFKNILSNDLVTFFFFIAERRSGHMWSDYDLIQTSGSRLYATIYESGHKYFILKATCTTYRLVLISIALLAGCLDLYGLSLSVYFIFIICIGSHGPWWLGESASLQGAGRGRKYLVSAQYHVAFHRISYGSGLRHITQVSGI